MRTIHLRSVQIWNILPRLFIIFVLCTSHLLVQSHENSIYKNVVIEINQRIPKAECSTFLFNLETAIKDASNQLYESLQRQIQFGEITIILPTEWPVNCLPSYNDTTSTNNEIISTIGELSDLTITIEHPIYRNNIWVEQYAGCGIQGKQIYASYLAFDHLNAGQEFAKQWVKYRYGIFDENGNEFDPIYPACWQIAEEFRENGTCGNQQQHTDDTNTTTTATIMNNENHESLRFCDDGNHNRYAPTKQNQLCNRRSVFDVILKHPDFHKSTNDNGNHLDATASMPKFIYKKRSKTRYVLVLDETQNTMIRESWTFLRLAIRNWVVYDLPENTDVGVVLANETGTSKQFDLSSLMIEKNRNLIASFIPFSPSESQKVACLDCAIADAQRMLIKQSKQFGAASSVILIIAPGMDSKTNYSNLIDTSQLNGIRIVSINYPGVIHRKTLDPLAKSTSGKSYTLYENKQNSERTYLTTYFNLVNMLYDIMVEYYEGNRMDLPVEIHRRKLFDINDDVSVSAAYSSKRSSRAITGTFLLDDNMGLPATFVLYTHNIEYPLINSVILTSPSGVTYTKRSDERLSVKQLMIEAPINEAGTWVYTIDRFNGNPQPHFVQVKATPRKYSNGITVRAWYEPYRSELFDNENHTNLIIIYVEVKKGENPINDALVEMIVTQPEKQCEISTKCEQIIRILDSGNGDPDITKGDGIYTRYFNPSNGTAIYQFDIQVNDNGNTAYSIPDQFISDEYNGLNCCGSLIPSPSKKQPISSFQRNIPTMTVFINDESSINYISDVGHINDLHVESVNTTKIWFSWTSPDIGGLNVAKYDVKYAFNVQDIVDNFDTMALMWDNDSPLLFTIGDHTTFTMNIPSELDLIGRTIYVAIRPYAQIKDAFKPAAISNFVRIHIEEPAPPSTVPTNFADGYNENGSADDVHVATGYIKDSFYFIILLVIMICISAILLVCCIIAIQLKKRRLSNGKSPKSSMCNTDKHQKCDNYNPNLTNNLIMTISNADNQCPSPTPPPHHTQMLHSGSGGGGGGHSDELSYIICPHELPNPHKVGLPLSNCDEEINKQSQYSVVQDWKNEWVDKYNKCDVQYHPYTVSTVSTNNLFTTTQNKILSPYESWTASQLLQEHEQRQLPHHQQHHQPHIQRDQNDIDQMTIQGYYKYDHLTSIPDLESNASDKGLVNTIIDSNSVTCSTQIPPLPYNTNNLNYYRIYSNDNNNQIDNKQMNQNYSTIIRNVDKRLKENPNPSLQGSLCSVYSANDVKKKTRNVTMV